MSEKANLNNRQEAERLVQQHRFGILVRQLCQHIADSDATECTFHLMPLPDKQQVELVVSDNDSHRFTDLHHVHAALNEMLLLAYCHKAKLVTTKGAVAFTENGMGTARLRSNMGAEFWATLDCDAEQYRQLVQELERVVVRPGLRLVVLLVEEDVPKIVRDETR